MSLTTLDPQTALIVIDLQQGIVNLPSAHPMHEVVGRAAQLAAAFRARSLPVVLVNVNGGAPGRTERPRRGGTPAANWAELVPELKQQPSDHTVTKQTWGAFTGTDLERHLRSLGVTQVVIAGVSTGAGVESTARQAHELGFNVTLAVDAMTDSDPETHLHSVSKVFPRLGETGTTGQILALL